MKVMMATKKHETRLRRVLLLIATVAIVLVNIKHAVLMENLVATDPDSTPSNATPVPLTTIFPFRHPPARDGNTFDSPHMKLVLDEANDAPPQRQDWTVPRPADPRCPDFCGDAITFAPFAHNHVTGRTLERGQGTTTFFRVHRPDLLERVEQAVQLVDAAGLMDKNSYCRTFDSCNERDKKKSRHSEAFLVCEQYRWLLASRILQGVSTSRLPHGLAEEGDSNVLCELAHYVEDLVSNVIFRSLGLEKRCVVQEQFINQQRNGAKTIQHVHEDDTYGGLFYLDTPPDTKLCFSNSEGSAAKQGWYKNAPQFTENLFPDAPPGRGADYPGHIAPQAGDIVFFPVGWLKHWVPQVHMGPDEKRTSLVFNMICI